MIYIKGTLIKGHWFWRLSYYFHSAQWGSLVFWYVSLQCLQKPLCAIFHPIRKINLSEYGCLALPWVEVLIFKQLTLETQCMFALSGSCKIIKVISACYGLITCKKALNDNFNADWIFMIILYKAWRQELTHWNCWVALNYSALTS